MLGIGRDESRPYDRLCSLFKRRGVRWSIPDSRSFILDLRFSPSPYLFVSIVLSFAILCLSKALVLQPENERFAHFFAQLGGVDVLLHDHLVEIGMVYIHSGMLGAKPNRVTDVLNAHR